MSVRRREFLKGASAGLASLAAPHVARAQLGSDTLSTISESGANSVDPHTPGANRGSYEVAWNCYDRLVSLQIEKDENGVDHANATKPAPGLAEEWIDSGHAVTFKLRRSATFHDGAPVTARDVKWSLDRAIAAGGNPKFQLSTGSMTSPEQFVAVDDHTFRIDYDRFDRQMVPNLAFSIPNILNSGLIKKNAAPNDPWGLQWSKNNLAGGGAYRIVNRTPIRSPTCVLTTGSAARCRKCSTWSGASYPRRRRAARSSNAAMSMLRMSFRLPTSSRWSANTRSMFT